MAVTRELIQLVICPVCQAKPGYSCTERGQRRKGTHAERIHLAEWRFPGESPKVRSDRQKRQNGLPRR